VRDPDHETRRTVIREWMALPRDKRASQEQAASFVAKAGERHTLQRPKQSESRMMAWLQPRVGRA
jgi:hypothetical protein